MTDQFVMQRGEYDCGVAALATIAGVSYRKAQAALHLVGVKHNLVLIGGTPPSALVFASIELGLEPESRQTQSTGMLGWDAVPDGSIVEVWMQGWHWVVRWHGHCWDPLIGWTDPPCEGTDTELIPGSPMVRATSYLAFRVSLTARRRQRSQCPVCAKDVERRKGAGP